MTGINIFSILNSVHHMEGMTCPYFLDNSSSGMEILNDEVRFTPGMYEQLLSWRFRRIGTMIYRPLCHGCLLCIPVRLNVNNFIMSKSQKRVHRRNKDTHCELLPLTYQREYFTLYSNYIIIKHGREPLVEDHFIDEYHQSPFRAASRILACYRETEQGRILTAASYIDILPDGVSSVYCIYDIENFGKLSLGIFTMLKEIELCKTLRKHWYYPGFWVAGCDTMEYKADFEPLEFCLDELWRPLTPEWKQKFRELSTLLSNFYQ